MLRLPLAALLAAALAVAAAAQPQVGGRQPVVTVDARAVVQSYETGPDRAVSETALPILVVAEVVPGLSVSARAVYASVDGDGLAALSGLGDTQLGVAYRAALGDALLDLSVLAGLPTGQTALDDGEFATAAALALDDFAFAVPSLGQGSAIVPAVALALPSGPGMAVGVGAAYAARGSYTLFDADPNAYTPADEIILTAGVDIGGEGSGVSLEGTYVIYGDDEYAGATFSPGDKLAGTLRVAAGGPAARAVLLARARTVMEGEVPATGRPVAYRRPQQGQLALTLGFGPRTTEVSVTGGVRYYGTVTTPESAIELGAFLAEQQVLIDVGGGVGIEVSPGVAVRASGTYTQGLLESVGGATLTGFRVSGGIRATF